MKKILLSLLLFSSIVSAQQTPPKDVYELEIPMTFVCLPSFMGMVNYLSDQYNELPMVMSQMSSEITLVLFSNQEKTTSSWVVLRKAEKEEEACIVWAGESEGASFLLAL
jgi:hypothetical protein